MTAATPSGEKNTPRMLIAPGPGACLWLCSATRIHINKQSNNKVIIVKGEETYLIHS